MSVLVTWNVTDMIPILNQNPTLKPFPLKPKKTLNPYTQELE